MGKGCTGIVALHQHPAVVYLMLSNAHNTDCMLAVLHDMEAAGTVSRLSLYDQAVLPWGR